MALPRPPASTVRASEELQQGELLATLILAPCLSLGSGAAPRVPVVRPRAFVAVCSLSPFAG